MRILNRAFANKLKKKLFSFTESNFVKPSLLFFERIGLRKPDHRINYSADVLWYKAIAGFSEMGVRDLESLKVSKTAEKDEKITAAVQLAKWYVLERDYETGLININFARKLRDRNLQSLRMIRSEILNRLGRNHEAREYLKDYTDERYANPNETLMVANSYNSPEEKQRDAEILRRLNWVFEYSNLLPVRKKDESQPLNIYNITADIPSNLYIDNEIKISVIMPTYNAQNTMGFVIESLLNQTWRNIELIIVDDCSTDSSPEIATNFAKNDNRVVYHRHTNNQGAYGARNTGGRLASGNYVTVNDSDDWAHPQKLEFQIKSLLEDSSIVANESNLVRVQEDLYFSGPWIVGKKLIRVNKSSLMFHRDLVHDLGGWDMVRVSADSELFERIKSVFGSNSLKNVLKDAPLTLSLDLDSNLTKKTDTHLRTLYYGKRFDYTEAARWWRTHSDITKLKIDPYSEKRNFQIPDSIKIKPKGVRTYDFLLIANFHQNDNGSNPAYKFMIDLLNQNMKIAIFHYPDYEFFTKQNNSLNDEIFILLNKFTVDKITLGDTINVKSIYFFNPNLLCYKIDSIPNIEFENLFIVTNEQTPSKEINIYGEDNSVIILDNIQKLFNSQAIWFASSIELKENLIKNFRKISISDFFWPVGLDKLEKSQ